MKAERTVAIVFGCIYLLAWTCHLFLLKFSTADDALMVRLIHSIPKNFASISLEASKYYAYAISGLNCLSCVVWINGVCTTNSKNKNWFLVLTTIWMHINLGLFIFSWLIIFLSYGISTFLHTYPYIFVVAVYVIAMHMFIFGCTCRIYYLFNEENRRRLRQKSLMRNPTDMNKSNQNLKYQNIDYERGNGHGMSHVNDWHSSPSYLSHHTYYTHDTHNSSHDTHTTFDIGGCDTGGGDTGGYDSGGCDSGGGGTCD